MLDNTITLNVNEDNDDGTTAAISYPFSRYEEYLNRSTYIHGGHSPVSRDLMAFYRTFPKVSGNFRGVSKSSVKFTTDVVVPGVDGVAQLTAPIIIEFNISVPVGASNAAVRIGRQKLVAILSNDSVMDALNITLMV
jgi:hypothetical protein